ncbi:MAG: hypothetical protein H0X34_09355 [Chthoniobacterales bacterium]|nr:hypothetical protein [Chthoniobacterales bacterium]
MAISDREDAFEFTTIRPGHYPFRNVPAHIHLTVEGGGVPRQWTEELRFADDPLVPASDLEAARKAGKFGDVRSVRQEGKTQHVELNIRAKRSADF